MKFKKLITAFLAVWIIISAFSITAFSGNEFDTSHDSFVNSEIHTQEEPDSTYEEPSSITDNLDSAEFELGESLILENEEVLFSFKLNEIIEDESNLVKVCEALDFHETLGEEFDLKESLISFESEFRNLYPQYPDAIHTIFIISTSNESIPYDFSDEVPQRSISYATIVVSQVFDHVNNQFEFSFRMGTLFSFPPLPDRPIWNATSQIHVSTVSGGIQYQIHSESFSRPSYGTWYSVQVNENTMYFNFTVTLTPESGTLFPNTASHDWLINRKGVVWEYDHTCPITGKQITPPPTYWQRETLHPRPSNIRTIYENYIRTTYNRPSFTLLSNEDVHHIRPLFLGGDNSTSNLIHINSAHHIRITTWFNNY